MDLSSMIDYRNINKLCMTVKKKKVKKIKLDFLCVQTINLKLLKSDMSRSRPLVDLTWNNSEYIKMI